MKQITDIDEGTIRRVDWQELVPPTILFRAFSATFSPAFLLLGALVLALLFATGVENWSLSETFAVYDCMRGSSNGGLSETFGAALSSVCELCFGFFSSWELFPIVRSLLTAFLMVWWTLALARSTAVRLTGSSRISIFSALRFGLKKFRSVILPVALPPATAFFGWVCAIALPRLGAVGVWSAPIAALAALLGVALFVVFALTVPLAFCAVATDGSDCFDAISRGISYATQRFLFFAIYGFFSFLLTVFGFFVVLAVVFPSAMIFSSVYAVGSFNALPGVESAFRGGVWTELWLGAIVLVPFVYLANCAVVYSSAIYVMLRRSVDGTPCDSCASDAKGAKTRSLQKIVFDGKGAPEFDSASQDSAKSDSAAEPKAGEGSEKGVES
ncbi:MAG: hypothetical protein IJM30_02825 [Thermoguttaceae bacterium]|nr:hypothetical protein [Thermoguttaceae bacterium]